MVTVGCLALCYVGKLKVNIVDDAGEIFTLISLVGNHLNTVEHRHKQLVLILQRLSIG